MDNSQSLQARAMELLVAYSRHPSLKLRNQLVQLNAGLVRKVAHQISNNSPEPYEDLEQIGFIGLIRAIERFDPHQGCAFSSFAVPYIRGEMLHYLRDKGSVMRIPRRCQELANRGRKVRQNLIDVLGRLPKDSEIAAQLGVSLQEWRECNLATQNHRPLSLDATIAQLSEGSLTLGETLLDPHYEVIQSWQDEQHQLQGAMSQLEEKTQAALHYVYVQDLPRKEAAREIGVSPMTVTRHLQKGLNQLVGILQPQVA